VDRAVRAVQVLLDSAGNSKKVRGDGYEFPPVYVRRQIVHNRAVVDDLAGQGAVFVQELDEIPQEAVLAGVPVVFSAHGVSPDVCAEAQSRGMRIVDASCPLVNKVHREALRYIRDGYEVIYIGHHGHDEVMGVIGESPEHIHLVESINDIEGLDFAAGTKLIRLNQTTLSIDECAEISAALHRRFPDLHEAASADICYATQNRQDAVKVLAAQADCVIVVGSSNSSNCARLVEVAQKILDSRHSPEMKRQAFLVDDASEVKAMWLEHVRVVGISSGASTPERVVQELVRSLSVCGFQQLSVVGSVKETMRFALPSQLKSLE
jgi:4-hydroxy-3-methylbut-2-enyl diphosphate reductase